MSVVLESAHLVPPEPVLVVAGEAVDHDGDGEGEDEDAAESAEAADELAREGGGGELAVTGGEGGGGGWRR